MHAGILLAFACALPTAASSLAGQQPAWQAEVRRLVSAGELSAALSVAERRLAAAPDDYEARGWRARLLSWLRRWSEAEAEYRKVLAAYPEDAEILAGLADVLAWQGRYEESLAVIERLRAASPGRAELHTREGRVLREMGRTEEARRAFRRALALAPGDREAQTGLASLDAARRHELRLGAEFDFFDFARDAAAASAALRLALDSRWTAEFGGDFFQRFGEQAGRLGAAATFRPRRSMSFTAGGAAAASDGRGVIARREAFLAYGHGFRLSESGFLRGLEAGYRQRWLWFRDARVLVAGPSFTLYFPREWSWAVQLAAARSRFPGAPAEWQPSGMTRLNFPLARALSGNVFFGVGAENFARADQLGRFAARTWGGGLRYALSPRHSVSGYYLYQSRSQQRRQSSLGISYAIRF